ncbi:hypothetical protein Landi51_11503 [Colletotrichum acutatum]
MSIGNPVAQSAARTSHAKAAADDSAPLVAVDQGLFGQGWPRPSWEMDPVADLVAHRTGARRGDARFNDMWNSDPNVRPPAMRRVTGRPVFLWRPAATSGPHTSSTIEKPDICQSQTSSRGNNAPLS